MASTKEYLEYVLDLLYGLDDISYRYMMSEVEKMWNDIPEPKKKGKR